MTFFGQYVLIADLFYYFGSCPVNVPAEYRLRVPQGSAKEGYITPPSQAERFIRFIQENYKTRNSLQSNRLVGG